MDKHQLRILIKDRLKGISIKDFENHCNRIHEHLFSASEWVQADTIAITISTDLEIQTSAIIEKAWKENKKVAVPKCNPKDRSMIFRYIQDFSQLETVYYHLQEPIQETTEEAQKTELDLIIVPGLVFDEQGFRIGFGGGYYDRYLQDFKGNTISLLMKEQLCKQVPREEYDIPVRTLILPNGVLTTYEGI